MSLRMDVVDGEEILLKNAWLCPFPSLPQTTVGVQGFESGKPHIGLPACVSPGQLITEDSSFMRGHGTFMEQGRMYASVAGVVERVNKLVSVKPLKARYIGEIGDVVVGRIVEVAQRRWKVDVNAHQHAHLQLSAIHLPGGVQRRKLESDELQIRKFYVEGELVSAEIQSIHADGSLAIHTRSAKYGKLANGVFLAISPSNVKRCKSHFHTLPCGVDVILGLNGYVWIGKRGPSAEDGGDLYAGKPLSISCEDRESIARVRNCIRALDLRRIDITDTMITFAYEASLPFACADLITSSIGKTVCEEALLHHAQLQSS